MSLVAYGSSDEGSEDEATETVTETDKIEKEETILDVRTSDKLCLPTPKYSQCKKIIEGSNNSDDDIEAEETSDKLHFETLPKPKPVEATSVIEEDDDDVLHKREVQISKPEKPLKKDRGPVKITVPSLSEFKDVYEEDEKKSNRIMPSKKGTGLFSLLPPPKMAESKSTRTLIPQSVAKKSTNTNQKPTQFNKTLNKTPNLEQTNKLSSPRNPLVTSNYDSNSEDEDDTSLKNNTESSVDFFSLSSTSKLPDIQEAEMSLPKLNTTASISSHHKELTQNYLGLESNATSTSTEDNDEKTLTSNIISLSKEEILLKNKAEVGPKLPVPEQEYNVDSAGNVAFDEKAIEYLCGKRGTKRKKEVEEANIIEINGEDIKPDERDWLVKALTEEPVQRPVSMMGGVNSTSKKKHQITYLAHQAKAMEMELKNQWAANRMTRKQTQSKYGF